MKRVAVVIRTADPARVAEALRAAVGLSLRGDRIDLVLAAPAPEGRALAVLRELGHRVGAPPAAIREADAVEVWT